MAGWTHLHVGLRFINRSGVEGKDEAQAQTDEKAHKTERQKETRHFKRRLHMTFGYRHLSSDAN